MVRINYRSDIRLIEDWPGTDDFVYHYYTDRIRCYKVSLSEGNCYRKEVSGKPKLVVLLNNHHLGKGLLRVTRFINTPDSEMPDGMFLKVYEDSTGITLTSGECDDVSEVDVGLFLPAYQGPKGDKGDPFTWDDFSEEQKEAFNSAQDIIERADAAIDSVSGVVQSAQDAASSAEASAEYARQAVEAVQAIGGDFVKKGPKSSTSGIASATTYTPTLETITVSSKSGKAYRRLTVDANGDLSSEIYKCVIDFTVGSENASTYVQLTDTDFVNAFGTEEGTNGFQELTVQVYKQDSSSYNEIGIDIRQDTAGIVLTWGTAPTSGTYRVIVSK